jgi:transposase
MGCIVARRPRRTFSKEYKREAVHLLRTSGKGVNQVARELGLTSSVLSAWKKMVEAEEKTGLSPDQLLELEQLRKDNARLRMEVDILGKATAFFANRNK